MTNCNFWEDWKNKSEIEINAIEKVRLARELVIKSVHKKVLIAIYIKGSFARREMKVGSDVDMVPIVSEYKYQGKIWETNIPEVLPVVIVPLSLDEFKENRLLSTSDQTPDLRALPDRFLQKLNESKLIYGKALDPNKFKIRTDFVALIEAIKVVKDGYILAYTTGKIDFSPLLKEFFWLVELELKVRGIKVEHSFQGILKAVKDRNHIIHQAFAFRQTDGTKAEKKVFIIKLKKYLKELEEIYN
jgi:hypothetical protein